MRKFITNFIHWTFGLSTNMLGFIVYHIFKITNKAHYEKMGRFGSHILIIPRFVLEALSLGKWIVVALEGMDDTRPYAKELIKHEEGHTIQSLCWGMLYLPIIFLSFLWAVSREFGAFKNIEYWDFPIEAFANELGDVDEEVIRGDR